MAIKHIEKKALSEHEVALREGAAVPRHGGSVLASFELASASDYAPLGASQSTEPGGMITWYVSGQSGATVTLDLARVQQSGGHAHDGGPTGTLSKSAQMFAISQGYPQNMPVFFRAPDASGSISLIARFSPGTPSEITVSNEVVVSGLVGLSQSTGLSLVGQTPTHSSNHWGTPALCVALAELGRQFHARFSKPIFVNDMSLQIGGLFDHKATWASPHVLHREGRHVDLNWSSMTDSERTFFTATAESLGFKVEIHPNPTHWHLFL